MQSIRVVAASTLIVSAGMIAAVADGPKPASDWKKISESVWRHSSNECEVVTTDTGFLGVPLLPGGQRDYRASAEYSTFNEAANGVLNGIAARKAFLQDITAIARSRRDGSSPQNKAAAKRAANGGPPTSWTRVFGDKDDPRQQWNSKSAYYAVIKDVNGYELKRRVAGRLVAVGDHEGLFASRDEAMRAAIKHWQSEQTAGSRKPKSKSGDRDRTVDDQKPAESVEDDSPSTTKALN